MEEQEPQTIDDHYNDPVVKELEPLLKEWLDKGQTHRQTLLECYQDKARIPREDDTKGTGMAKSNKAKGIFIGSTRSKIRSSRAKIKDTLFGTGEMPFDTNPTNDELKEFSDAMEKILRYQLDDMGYRSLIGDGVDLLCTYGTGLTFGPFNKQKTITEVKAQEVEGYTSMVEENFTYDCPYFELAPTLDIVADADAADEESAQGLFWVSKVSPHYLKTRLLTKDNKEKIQAAIQAATAVASNDTDFDTAKRLRGYQDVWFGEGKITLARYFGRISAKCLCESDGEEKGEGAEDAETEMDELETVEVLVVMAGGVLLKVDRNPLKRRTAYRAVYEKETHEFWGVGVAENNFPHQKNVNAAFRLFSEGKAMALLGTRSVDKSCFLEGEDFKKYPGKVYQMKPHLSADERKNAIIHHDEIDVSDGWLSLIEMSERFSDDDTSITKYNQGNDARALNQTATGISMIMNASNLPTKEVLENIDTMWIEQHIEALIEWDMKYLEMEVVQKLLGDEVAATWQAIKQFGKTSFLEWKATGTKTFMAKEVMMSKLQGFLAIVGSNAEFMSLTDMRELLEQIWDSAQLSTESPIYSEDDLAKKKQEEGTGAQTMAIMQLVMKELPDHSPLKVLVGAVMLQQTGQMSDQVMQVVQQTLKNYALEGEKTQAEIDKTDAETVDKVVRANVGPR